MYLMDPRQLRLDAVLEVEREFDFLSDEYRRLYAASSATAFQAPLWQQRIHQHLVPHLRARPYTITLRRRADAALLAVFPFVIQRSFGLSIVQPADFGVCDYNAIVAPPDVLEALLNDETILERLDRLVSVGSLLLFRKIRSDGFEFSRLFRSARSNPAENPAFHSIIDDDFEAWRRRTLSRHMTKELERKGRQIEAEHGRYSTAPAITPEQVEAGMAFIRRVRAGRFENDLLQNPVHYKFYRDYAVAAAESGEAILYLSLVEDEPIAALFGLLGDGDFHAVLIAADMERFGRYSPGTQILYRTIQARHAEGHRYFDMCIGNSGYKSHFRVAATPLVNFSAAHSMRGTALAAVYHHAKPLKNSLRALVPHVR